MNRIRWDRIVLGVVLLIAIRTAVPAQVTFGMPVNMGPNVNSAANDGSPSMTADGLELYFHSNRTGGFGANDIWVCTRASMKQPWGMAINLGPVVNSPAMELAPTVSSDGLELIFSDYSMPRSGGVGKTDLWVTLRPSRGAAWGKPVNLGSLVNSGEDEITPTLSVNGLELFLDSYRDGGMGASDLWVARRESRSSQWGKPEWLGTTLNSVGVEHCPTITADGLTLFYDMTPPNQKEEIGDLMMTRRETLSDPWGPPVNLGHDLSVHYASCISHDGTILYLTSKLAGGLGNNDIWQVPINLISARK